jgi:hypothetical protein
MVWSGNIQNSACWDQNALLVEARSGLTAKSTMNAAIGATKAVTFLRKPMKAAPTVA